MKKILQIVGGLQIGGLENVVMNYYRNIDRTKFHFDFLVYGDNKGDYEDEAIRLGGRVLRIPAPSEGYYRFYKNLKTLIKSEGPYDIIHSHTLFQSGIIAYCGYHLQVPKIVTQSHSNQKNKKRTIMKRLYQTIMRKFLKKYSNDYLAVSKEAGNFLYGRNFFEVHGKIINNGIDINKFSFNPQIRQEIRKKLNITNETVIGHVGTMNEVKNQSYLVKLLPHLLKRDQKFVMILVGEGPNLVDLKNLSKSYGIQSKIIFLDKQTDVSKILQAIDIFVFPSLYEGLGMALLEAQAASLPSIVSENIPNKAIVNSNVKVIPLRDIDSWIESILDYRNYNRMNQEILLEENGFGINTTIEQLTKIYNS